MVGMIQNVSNTILIRLALFVRVAVTRKEIFLATINRLSSGIFTTVSDNRGLRNKNTHNRLTVNNKDSMLRMRVLYSVWPGQTLPVGSVGTRQHIRAKDFVLAGFPN